MKTDRHSFFATGIAVSGLALLLSACTISERPHLPEQGNRASNSDEIVSAEPKASSDLISLLPPPLQECVNATPDSSTRQKWTRRSLLVPAEDGTRLALDLFLPEQEAGNHYPTLFVSTRYWRGKAGEGIAEEFQPWIDDGYAVVVADVRGTGASFGHWYIPYTLQEAKDIGFLANWIAQQKWSNGQVVTTGNSYPGTTSLMSPAFGAPAVKAIIPRFSDFDMYEDLLFPGGVPASRLIVDWGHLVRNLDMNTPMNGKTVRPVDGPSGEALLSEAIAQHSEVSGGFDQAADVVTFRDDRPQSFNGHSFSEGGVYQLKTPIERSKVPIFGWGSWMDSGIAQGMLNRFNNWSNPQISVIGAWTHGARADADPFKPIESPLTPAPEMQRRIDRCFAKLTLTGKLTVKPQIIYYTMGEGVWRSTPIWPIADTKPLTLHLSAGGQLAIKASPQPGSDSRTVDFSTTTGALNRWMTQAGAPDIDYSDRSEQDKKLLTYDSAPLEENLEVTGSVVVDLMIRSSQPDSSVFVYLEDIAPDGRITYITEGQLRALHRKPAAHGAHYATVYPTHSYLKPDAMPLEPGKATALRFQLQPVSVLFRKGHRIRIAIAGADQGNFKSIPEGTKNVTISIGWGGENGSSVVLPIIDRSR